MKQHEEIISEGKEAENVSESTAAQSQTEAVKVNEVEKLQADLAEQKDKFIRLYSEFENFRRRTNKEKSDLIQSASEQLIKTLLPVMDDFERAEKTLDKELKELEGVFLIQNKFRKILEHSGVKSMDVKAGSQFNADLHEAIAQVPAADESLKGKVVDVIEPGYLLNDKVIRFAKVVVGS
jgi:molecular chaperone GrpE